MAYTSSLSLLQHFLVVLLLLTTLAEARPRPKAAWVRAARSKLAKSSNFNKIKRDTEGSVCHEVAPEEVRAPHKNVWSGLTDKEAADVTKWLFAQKGLNLTVSENATEWSNSVLLVELMIPNKTDVLAYIDGDAKAPTRYAHVVLDLRTTDQPTYTDILVGPLPVQNLTTTWQGLEYPYTRKTSGSIRNLDADEDAIHQFLYNVSATLSDITLDLWGGTALGLKNDTVGGRSYMAVRRQNHSLVWLNLGMHHLPHTGDLPNTVFTTAHSPMQFMPLNYYDQGISRETRSMVPVDYNNGTAKVKTFGQNRDVCKLDTSTTAPSLYDYQGGIVIRKFPYDPVDWYYETDSIVKQPL